MVTVLFEHFLINSVRWLITMCFNDDISLWTYHYNYNGNLYSGIYSAGQKRFTNRKAKPKIQHKIESKYKDKVNKVNKDVYIK